MISGSVSLFPVKIIDVLKICTEVSNNTDPDGSTSVLNSGLQVERPE